MVCITLDLAAVVAPVARHNPSYVVRWRVNGVEIFEPFDSAARAWDFKVNLPRTYQAKVLWADTMEVMSPTQVLIAVASEDETFAE